MANSNNKEKNKIEIQEKKVSFPAQLHPIIIEKASKGDISAIIQSFVNSVEQNSKLREKEMQEYYKLENKKQDSTFWIRIIGLIFSQLILLFTILFDKIPNEYITPLIFINILIFIPSLLFSKYLEKIINFLSRLLKKIFSKSSKS